MNFYVLLNTWLAILADFRSSDFYWIKYFRSLMYCVQLQTLRIGRTVDWGCLCMAVVLYDLGLGEVVRLDICLELTGF